MTSTLSTPSIATAEGGLTVVQALASGELRIAGYATRWAIDRTNDRFVPGAFSAAGAIDRFMNGDGGQPLRFHHHNDATIGQVESLSEDDHGLFLVGRVAYREPGEFLRPVYDGIVDRRIKGLSVGGYWDRRPAPHGSDIWNVSKLTEVSATHSPTLRTAGFDVIDVGASPDPSADALAAANLARLRAEVLVMGSRA